MPMPALTLTISLPESLYEHLLSRAERAGRSLEDEVAELLAATVADAEPLAPELEEELASMALLDDESLWRAARSHLAADAVEHLEALHLKAQDEGLTETEDREAAALTHRYERGMLVRAEAAYLLKQRGYDVNGLLDRP
jgi:plasmid stability protein